jgi:hypothetical protein
MCITCIEVQICFGAGKYYLVILVIPTGRDTLHHIRVVGTILLNGKMRGDQ